MIGPLPSGIPTVDGAAGGPWALRLWTADHPHWVHEVIVDSAGRPYSWWMGPAHPALFL